MIFPYGYKIKEKINLEKTGENAEGKKVNVFDPANGKDFRLIVKKVGDWPNYDSSTFRGISPLKMWNEEKKTFVEVPVEWSEEKEKYVISNPKVQQKVIHYLTEKDVNLEDHAAKRWTEEDKVHVEKIIEILSGKDFSYAKESIDSATTATPVGTLADTSLDDGGDGDDLDDFFDE